MYWKRNLRKHLFVDAKVQGTLINRAVGYWFFCLLTLTLMILCWRMATGPVQMFSTHFDEMWFSFAPAFIGSFILLPLVVYDILRMSNRFVGPLVRLRRSMRALARGEDVEPLKFRDGDIWHDFAQEFNDLAARVQKLKQGASSDKVTGSEEREDEAILAGTLD
jgi:hypothetical protein